jgi:1-phosphatidylinositol-3-phosphate 5-kinase
MFHLRIMLQQMLKTENIPDSAEWEEVLMKLALRIAREMTFTAHPQRQGADMDVRRYVKIKKIPGGLPSHSEYVDGAVITKNVAHKQMLRELRNPRVMIVTFPLEFHRVEGQYMHFGQIVRQEKEYLGNLAARIAALRPHVILVEKSVSRLALDQLAKHKIAVARSVKPSAITFVSRMTQGDIFSSMDKLAVEPRLGQCQRFRIQTFDHPLIPGRRKTYLRFEGCNPDMGCTIILRGGDIDTLRRVKKVTRFLAFTVRNLKLETHLWKDSVITLPNLTRDPAPAPFSTQGPSNLSAVTAPTPSPHAIIPTSSHERKPSSPSSEDDLPIEDAEQLRVSRRIQESLNPYLETFISVSATLRFPPPYPIRRMKELDEELKRDKRSWEDEVISREEKAQILSDPGSTASTLTVTPKISQEDDIRAMIESLPTPDIIDTPGSEPRPSVRKDVDYFTHQHVQSSSSVPSSPLPSLKSTDIPLAPLKTCTDIALESRLSHARWLHEEQRRIWEWYLRKNKDDFDVDKYQRITIWEMRLPISEYGHRRPCFPPQMKYITFYGDNDCTLGRFIEESVHDTLVQFLDPKAVCSGKSCNQPLSRHCTVYVHNETQILVATEQWDGQINGRALHQQIPELITTWSLCRLCGSATPFIPVSQEMQRYSLAKFLELHFYPADVELVQGAGCHHNIYINHIRYFAFHGMTVRFQADPIVLHEVVYPPMRIRVRPETLLELKNADYQRLLDRNVAWYAALIEDLRNIVVDAATGDEEHDVGMANQVNHLIERAKSEREEIARLLNQLYTESAPTDTLALNKARAYRQDKIVAWQQDFDKLPKPKLAGLAADRGGRRTSAFGTVSGLGSMWQKYGLLDYPNLPSSSVSEAEEGLSLRRRVTGISLASTAFSDASASESEAGDGASEKDSAGSLQNHDASPKPLEPNDGDGDSDSTIGASRRDTEPAADLPSSDQVRIVRFTCILGIGLNNL